MDKARIHNELLKRLRAGPYYETAIDPNTSTLTVLPDVVQPTGAAVVEKNSTFSLSQHGMRTLASERTSWIWEGHVQFPSTTVSAEEAEIQMTNEAIRIPAAQNEQRSLLAALVATEYIYPPEQSPNGGTTVVFTFQILPQSLRK